MTLEELKAQYEDLTLQLQMLDFNEADDKKLNEQQELSQLKDQYKSLTQQLEELDKSEAQRKEQQELWDSYSDAEKARLYGSQALGSMEEGVLMGADMLTAPYRLARREIAGENDRSPSQYFKQEFGIGADYVPEGDAKEVADAIGALGAVGFGMTGVQRTGATVTDVTLDILGLGSSAGTNAQRLTQRTQDAINKSDSVRLGADPDKLTDQQVFQRAQETATRIQIEQNRGQFDAYEALIEKAPKLEDGTREVSELVDTELLIEAPNIGMVLEELGKQKINPAKAVKIIGKKGGLKFSDDMEELIEMDKQFTQGSGRNADQFLTGGLKSWYDRNLLPVSDAIRKYGDRRVGGIFERAIETNVRYNDVLAQKHMKPLKRVVELVNRNKQLKGDMLDLFREPSKMKDIRATIEKELDADAVKAFDSFMQDAGKQNQRSMKSLFKDEPDTFGDVYYLHTQKRSKKASIFANLRLASRGGADEAKMALKDRTRAPSAKLIETGEIDEYVNPLLSHMKYMAEQDQLIRLSEGFNMRPALGSKDSAEDFFLELSKKLKRDGLTTDQSDVSAGLMLEAFSGAKKAPPPAIRAFMSQSYAFTLGQLKSATLNSHDVFVAAFTQGGRNTLKGLKNTMKREFGKTLDEMGMSSQGVGEFVRNFDDTLDNPSLMDRVAKRSQQLTDGAMYISFFRAMDKWGKSKVLLASVEKMKDSARKGILFSEYSDIASKQELQKIRPYLKAGTKAKDMPKEVASIVEELAFVALGKQQLISYAGRPLGYLKNPILRPLYALTGFAIKQQALLRDMMGSAIRQGNYATAGAIAAKYALYAGMGYGLIDEMRSVAFKKEEWDEEDVLMGVVDQLAAAATFNRLGSTYERERFSQDPYQFIMQSLLPPGGMVEASAKDLSTILNNLFTDKETKVPDKTLEKLTVLGDFYKYYMKKEEREDG